MEVGVLVLACFEAGFNGGGVWMGSIAAADFCKTAFEKSSNLSFVLYIYDVRREPIIKQQARWRNGSASDSS